LHTKAAFTALWLAGLATAGPAFAADPAEQAPLAERTAETGAPLGAVQQAMETPHLALALTVDPAGQSITGRADYTVRATTPLETVEFDLDPRLAVSEITLGGRPLAGGQWSSEGGLISIALPAPLAAGETANVGIAYAGKPRVAPRAPWDGGFVWSGTEQGEPWIATAVQPNGCDLFWPCLDHPSKRVDLLDFRVTVPKPLVVAANGRLIETTGGDGVRTYHWRARQPNGYGVSLQIAPYELARAEYASRYGNTIPIRFWHLPGRKEGAERLVAEMHDFLDFFESTIGPYPFGDEKVGLAETPHLGMEHQTINAYGEGHRLAPEGYDWLMHHEFAHEWFANQLTNESTADMWLHEGFGTYMQPLYLKWKNGDAAYQAALWDLRKKIKSRVPLVPEGFVPSAFFDDRQAGWGDDIYYKGAWILHTLREHIGDEAFFTATRRLTYGRDNPAPGNFAPLIRSTEDFRRIVEDMTGEDLGWFFDAYFRTAALPELVATRDGSTPQLAWQTGAAEPFTLPVEVDVDGKLVTVAMDGGSGSLQLPSAEAHFVLDPNARILRGNAAITAWQKQQEAAEAKQQAGTAATE
jgi:aminopeptidase N